MLVVLFFTIMLVGNNFHALDSAQAATQGSYYTDADIDYMWENNLYYTATEPVEWKCFNNISSGFCPARFITSGSGCPSCPSPPGTAVTYIKYEYINSLSQEVTLGKINFIFNDEWAKGTQITKKFNLILCYDSGGNVVAQCVEPGSHTYVDTYICIDC